MVAALAACSQRAKLTSALGHISPGSFLSFRSSDLANDFRGSLGTFVLLLNPVLVVVHLPMETFINHLNRQVGASGSSAKGIQEGNPPYRLRASDSAMRVGREDVG